MHAQIVEHKVHRSFADLFTEQFKELLELDFVNAAIVLHHKLDAFILADRHDACNRLVSSISAIDRECYLLRSPSMLQIGAGREHYLVDEYRCESSSLEPLLLGDEVHDLLVLIIKLGTFDNLAELYLLLGDPMAPVDLP